MPKLSKSDLQYLANYSAEAEWTDSELNDPIPPEFPETNSPAPDTKDNGWWPDLGPSQMKIFNSTQKYVLAHGERGSGKGIGNVHKCARHAWENWDALVIMSAIGLTGATAGGPWHDLVDLVLPQWEQGIGLKWIGPRMDTSRNAYIKIGNVYGGWSTIMLKSIPSESVISQRFKGTAPSLIFFDELTEAKHPQYVKKLGQQIGRRRGIKCQQFIAACNPSPEGEDNWVYKMFLEEPEGESDLAYWNKNYFAQHVPMHENKWMDNREDYISDLKHQAKDDPTEYARIVEGKWVKQMVGQGIFKDYFMKNIHVKGNAAEGRRFLAQPNLPITVGYDMGDVNQGVVFMQQVPVKDKSVWVQLDELVTIGKKISFQFFVRMILEKMNDIVRRSAAVKGLTVDQARSQYYFEHISDNSTMRFRAAGGDIEKDLIADMSALEIAENGDVYPYLVDSIMMMPAPKGDGQVEQRSRLLIDLLQNNRYLADSGCKNTIDMFMNIVAKKDSIFAPDGRSPYKHVLDALTYPIIYYAVNGTPPPRATSVKPMVY